MTSSSLLFTTTLLISRCLSSSWMTSLCFVHTNPKDRPTPTFATKWRIKAKILNLGRLQMKELTRRLSISQMLLILELTLKTSKSTTLLRIAARWLVLSFYIRSITTRSRSISFIRLPINQKTKVTYLILHFWTQGQHLCSRLKFLIRVFNSKNRIHRSLVFNLSFIDLIWIRLNTLCSKWVLMYLKESYQFKKS